MKPADVNPGTIAVRHHLTTSLASDGLRDPRIVRLTGETRRMPQGPLIRYADVDQVINTGWRPISPAGGERSKVIDLGLYYSAADWHAHLKDYAVKLRTELALVEHALTEAQDLTRRVTA